MRMTKGEDEEEEEPEHDERVQVALGMGVCGTYHSARPRRIRKNKKRQRKNSGSAMDGRHREE